MNLIDVNKFPTNTASKFINEITPHLINYSQISLRMISIPILENTISLIDQAKTYLIQSKNYGFYVYTYVKYTAIDLEDNISVELSGLTTVSFLSFLISPFNQFIIEDELKTALKYLQPYYSDSYCFPRKFNKNELIFSFPNKNIKCPHFIFVIPIMMSHNHSRTPLPIIATIVDESPSYLKSYGLKNFILKDLDKKTEELSITLDLIYLTVKLRYKLVPFYDLSKIDIEKTYWPILANNNYKQYVRENYKDPNKIIFYSISFLEQTFTINDSAYRRQEQDLQGDNEQLYIHLEELANYRIANQNENILSDLFFDKTKIFNQRITEYQVMPLSLPLKLLMNNVSRLTFDLSNAVGETNLNIDNLSTTIILCKLFSVTTDAEETSREINAKSF